jgi:RNase H-like domain found in reverse transcriptase
MAAVLLQADPEDAEARQREQNETAKAQACEFDKHKHKLRLRPIAFSSRKCSESEGGVHSYTGEAATGVWAIEKYKRHLFGKEFTWMTDCNGLRQFFDGDDVPTHMHQRMRQRLLRFMFTIVHRPARFMVECDVLTRYNNITTQWRPTKPSAQPQPTAIAIANDPIPGLTNQRRQPRTWLLAIKCSHTRTIWAFNAGATNIHNATTDAGIKADIIGIEERQAWRTNPFDSHTQDPKLTTIMTLEETVEPTDTIDWIIAHNGIEKDNKQDGWHKFKQLTKLIALGTKHGVQAIIIFTSPDHHSDGESRAEKRMQQLETDGWSTLRANVHANRYGASIATRFTMIIATRQVETLRMFYLQGSEAQPLSEYINDESEIHEPHVHHNDNIREMKRPHQAPQQNTQEPRIAALIQRKGQGKNDNTVEWTTTWTPCYDTEHPGPADLNDLTNQWFESPFAIESTDNRTHTSRVRGIRQHELIDIIGYDEDSRHRMFQ